MICRVMQRARNGEVISIKSRSPISERVDLSSRTAKAPTFGDGVNSTPVTLRNALIRHSAGIIAEGPSNLPLADLGPVDKVHSQIG